MSSYLSYLEKRLVFSGWASFIVLISFNLSLVFNFRFSLLFFIYTVLRFAPFSCSANVLTDPLLMVMMMLTAFCSSHCIRQRPRFPPNRRRYTMFLDHRVHIVGSTGPGCCSWGCGGCRASKRHYDGPAFSLNRCFRVCSQAAAVLVVAQIDTSLDLLAAARQLRGSLVHRGMHWRFGSTTSNGTTRFLSAI